MKLFTLLPIALFSLLPSVTAYASLGCFSGVYGGTLPPFTASSGVDCATQCETRLAAAPFAAGVTPYSYWSNLNGACTCRDASPPPDAIASPRSCLPGNAVNNVYRLQTSYTFEGCRRPRLNTIAQFVVTNFNECFDSCRSSLRAEFDVSADSEGVKAIRCECSNDPVDSRDSADCESFLSAYTYRHPPAAAASMLNRRKRHVVKKAEDYCPGSLTACRISGSAGYECIDTSSELESCGGCMHGQYSLSGVKGTKGINCAALDGGLYGTLTCKAGRCVDV